MRKVKLVLILVITTIFVITSSFPFASVVMALCSGTGCNNTDPNTTGCYADAATVRTVYPASGKARVELRFSDACQTRWSKTVNIAGLNYYANATLRYWYYGAQYIAPGYTVYSNQRYGSGYQACGDVGSSAMNYLINDSARCTTAY
jgi:hypothetical protein